MDESFLFLFGGSGEIFILKDDMNMDFEMEEIVCPICEKSGGDPLHLEGSFQMVRCPSCQFIFLNPRPTAESLHHFYQTYLPEEESSIESWERMMKPVFDRAANLLERYGRNGRLLDVGIRFWIFCRWYEEQRMGGSGG